MINNIFKRELENVNKKSCWDIQNIIDIIDSMIN